MSTNNNVQNNETHNANNTLNYKDIPIINKCKNLGITLDNNLKTIFHLLEINQKMRKYMEKNDFLFTDYFSIKSLRILHQHFH